MGRPGVDFSIHAEYTSNPETVKKIAEYNEKINTRIHPGPATLGFGRTCSAFCGLPGSVWEAGRPGQIIFRRTGNGNGTAQNRQAQKDSRPEDSPSLPEADSVFSSRLCCYMKCLSSSFLLSESITFSLLTALSSISLLVSSVRFCASRCIYITVLAISERYIFEMSPVAMPTAFNTSLVLN